MVEYDQIEQDRLIAQHKEKIMEAFQAFKENMSEIYGYDGDETVTRQAFIRECIEVLDVPYIVHTVPTHSECENNGA